MSNVTDENKTEAMVVENEGNEEKKHDEASNENDNLVGSFEAIELDTTDFESIKNKVGVYLEQGKYDEALKLCEKVIEVTQENRANSKLIAEAYYLTGECYNCKEQYEEALKYYEKSLTKHYTREASYSKSDVKKTIKRLERENPANFDPDKSLRLKRIGDDLFEKKDFENAHQYYEAASKHNPHDLELPGLCELIIYMGIFQVHDELMDCLFH